MKKQIFFIVIASSATMFFSCRKNATELKETNSATEQMNSASKNLESNININPLLYKLEGWYRFNGNLNDATGKLASGFSVKSAAQYTIDHKGFLNSALKLNGSSFVKLMNVPVKTSSSISVWVKTVDLDQTSLIVSSSGEGLFILQNPTWYLGALTLAGDGWSWSYGLHKEVSDLNWHHLVTTYDGTILKFYFDGSLAGSQSMSGSINSVLKDYFIAHNYWRGAVDELRFYSRALTPVEVQSLYNL